MAEGSRMITDDDILRIDELWKREQSETGLDPDEKKEQRMLREAYILAVKENLRDESGSTEHGGKDGGASPLKKKHDR